MKLKLKTGDRLNLSSILPKEGNMITLGLVEDISNKIKMSQKEIEAVELVAIDSANGQGFRWNDELDKEKTFDLTEAEANLLKSEVKKLDESGRIPVQLYQLCKKITS
jgi:hypothetical protein